MRPTFDQQDRILEAREAKRAEVVPRLAKVLAAEFDRDEIIFLWSFGPGTPSVILVEAFERARLEAKK
jgi:hypothetical protein